MNNDRKFVGDVAVIGAGPAGITAATVAAEAGKSVILLDDNLRPGGQIWRGGRAPDEKSTGAQWIPRLQTSTVRQIFGASVFHIQEKELCAEGPDGLCQVSFEKLILATGARERFLPFPGWTLPGVLGAGGLQALIKSGLPVSGKRIVIAGTGPLLLAVAAYAKQKGAIVVGIADQTSWTKFIGFGASALLDGKKTTQALNLLWHTRGIPHWMNSWPVAALGTSRIQTVRLSRNGKPREFPCDYLACGFHLVPSTELAQLVGCNLQSGFVAVDEFQRTSVPGVLCAGESTGIGGLEKSLLEGQIAGFACAGQFDRARDLASARATAQRHVKSMKQAFALRAELKALPEEDTLICRCEDVALGKLRGHSSWRDAKLQTRCGMGACQARVCGAAAEFLFGWRVGSIRPPAAPVSCASLAAVSVGAKSETIQGGLQ